jgi:sterol desaturase/sphingolipid hydroxylase (fatty acid hydroxylase superfamily)
MFALLFFFTFTGSSLFCYYIDINHTSLRVKHESNEIVKKEYLHMLPQVITNLFIGTILLYIIDLNFYAITNNYYFFVNFFLWFIFTDCMFFFIHKTLHRKELYYLHKKHHEYIYTYGIGSIYSSCFEFIVGNIFPLSYSIILLRIPRSHAYIITMIATFFTVIVSHGGYFKQNKHLQHHIIRSKNFGLGLSDRIYSIVQL